MKNKHLFLAVIFALFVMVGCDQKDPEVKKSSLNSIESFKILFEGVDDKDVKYELGDEIKVSVPFKTKITGVKTEIKVSDSATVSPASGEAVDFEDGKVKDFVVTAQDGTKKTYQVTVTVRVEVGSGSRIKDFVLKENYGFFVNNDSTHYKYNDKTNFVSSYFKGDKEYVFVYDANNQITELKNSKDEEVTTYTYNDKGLIISAAQKVKGEDKYTYAYTYNEKNQLTKLVRNAKGSDKPYEQKFEYTDGNVTKYFAGTLEYKATFDDKNNPFMGIYPSAYAKILVGNSSKSVSKNNPTSRGAIKTITYEYNTDGYPKNMSYTTETQIVKATYSYY